MSDVALHEKIMEQLEHYFGDENYPKDPWMQRVKDGQGWITIHLMLKCNVLRRICNDPETIANAVSSSSSRLVQLSGNRRSLRRNPNS